MIVPRAEVGASSSSSTKDGSVSVVSAAKISKSPKPSKVAREAGFSNVRRAAQTPVNLILELTP